MHWLTEINVIPRKEGFARQEAEGKKSILKLSVILGITDISIRIFHLNVVKVDKMM